MADKLKNTMRKGGFGPLVKRPSLSTKKRKNRLMQAENEWVKRVKARRAKGDLKARDALKEFELRKQRIKFAKENPLMPRTKPKRLKVCVRTGASGLSKLSKELNK